MNFLRSRNAQNGDEKQSVSSSYESKQQLSLAQQKQQNKDTKELLQSLATTSWLKKQKQTASKNMGYLTEVLFFNAFELGLIVLMMLS